MQRVSGQRGLLERHSAVPDLSRGATSEQQTWCSGPPGRFPTYIGPPAAQSSEFVIKLKALEDGLLSKLSSAQGDLTEDEALIVSLEESKALAEEISEKVGGWVGVGQGRGGGGSNTQGGWCRCFPAADDRHNSCAVILAHR